MASIKNLKKDINHVLGDIMDAAEDWKTGVAAEEKAKANAIIDEAIETFDTLMEKVNDKSVESKKAHLKSVRETLETKATALVEKLNKLS